jgi:hypothetical protein
MNLNTAHDQKSGAAADSKFPIIRTAKHMKKDRRRPNLNKYMNFNLIHLHHMCITITVRIIHCVPVLNKIYQPNNIALQILQP